jgi:hypothetical protein
MGWVFRLARSRSCRSRSREGIGKTPEVKLEKRHHYHKELRD